MLQAWFYLTILIFVPVYSSLEDEPLEGVAFAEVQSCKGCQLRGLPEVKDFIFEDVPHYNFQLTPYTLRTFHNRGDIICFSNGDNEDYDALYSASGDNVVFKAVHGAPPELILYDGDNKELKRIALREYTRRGCNELMEQYGFKRSKKIEL